METATKPVTKSATAMAKPSTTSQTKTPKIGTKI